MFAVIEFGRMALVYNNVANAARVGLRYAITHGCDRSGTDPYPMGNRATGQAMGLNTVAGGCSVSPSPDPTGIDICSAVKDYAKSGLINPNLLACQATSGGRIQITWPDTLPLVSWSNQPGARVQVTVVYPYDPFFALPIKVPLGSTSEGVITF